MPATLLSLLAAKAKATALVAATVGVTVAAVGGGSVVLQNVSDTTQISDDVVVEVSPEPSSEPSPEESAAADPAESPEAPDESPDALDDDVDDLASPPVDTEPSPDAEPPADEETVEDVPATVAFTCDPSLNHGQNVSAYARSLPRGPGRGELVSAVAQSDCGKTAGTEGDESEPEEAPEVEAPEAEQGEAAPDVAPMGEADGKRKGAERSANGKAKSAGKGNKG